MMELLTFLGLLMALIGWYFGDQHGYARRQREEMLEIDLRDRMAELIEPEDRL